MKKGKGKLILPFSAVEVPQSFEPPSIPLPESHDASLALLTRLERELPERTNDEKRAKDLRLAPLRRHWHQIQQGPQPPLDAVAPRASSTPANTRHRERFAEAVKRRMKAVACVALFLVPFAASAQEGREYELLGGGTNSISALSTNVYSITLAVSECDNMGLQLTARGHSGNPGSISAFFTDSLNSTEYSTASAFAVTLPLDATNLTSVVTNWPLPGEAVVKLVSIANTNSVAITNIQLRARFKVPKRVLR